MAFNENLRVYRNQCGMTQKELGEKIGVTPVTIGNWERGVRQPSFEFLVKISDALDTSIDTLLDKAHRRASAIDIDIEGLVRKYKLLDSHGKQVVNTICTLEFERVNPMHDSSSRHIQREKQSFAPIDIRRLPLYASPSAAGINTPIENSDFEMLQVDNTVPSSADYAVRISGDSMEPYIKNGQIVFVDEDADVEEGDVGIFCVNGEMYCKQYYLDKNQNLHLLSANPRREDVSIHISRDSESSVKCCGKVLLGFHIPLPSHEF